MKNKVENGEVIEAFRKQFNDLYKIISVDPYSPEQGSLLNTKYQRCNYEVEALITNALKEQRELLIKEIKEGVLALMQYPVSEGRTEKVYLVGTEDIIEFLTKLEKGKEE